MRVWLASLMLAIGFLPVGASSQEQATAVLFRQLTAPIQLDSGWQWYGGGFGIGWQDDRKIKTFSALAVKGTEARLFESQQLQGDWLHLAENIPFSDRIALELAFWDKTTRGRYLVPGVSLRADSVMPIRAIKLAKVTRSFARSQVELDRVLKIWSPPLYGVCGTLTGPDGYELRVFYNQSAGGLVQLITNGKVVDWVAKPSFLAQSPHWLDSIVKLESVIDWVCRGFSPAYPDKVKARWEQLLAGTLPAASLHLNPNDCQKLKPFIGKKHTTTIKVSHERLSASDVGSYGIESKFADGKSVYVKYCPYDPYNMTYLYLSPKPPK